MSHLVAEAGKPVLLAKMLEDAYLLKLFVNDVTPSPEDAASDYQEPPATACAPVRLEHDGWALQGATASYPPVVFRFQERVDEVYGFFVVHAATGKLMWSRRFPDGPYRVSGRGFEVEIKVDVTI